MSRNFDIIKESLGETSSNFVLVANHNATIQTTKTINKITSYIMENGLYMFYFRFAAFMAEINGRYDFEPFDYLRYQVTFEQFSFPMIILGAFLSLAVFVFVIEIGYPRIACM